MHRINPKYLHPIVGGGERKSSDKEMKYMKTHYSRVIPATTPQYAKMSPSPASSPVSPQFYRYETPTYSLKENEKLPSPDRPEKPLL